MDLQFFLFASVNNVLDMPLAIKFHRTVSGTYQKRRICTFASLPLLNTHPASESRFQHLEFIFYISETGLCYILVLMGNHICFKFSNLRLLRI